MFKFAKSSLDKLKEVHSDLQIICHEVKHVAEIDFDISCGYRTPEDQMKAYNKGNSPFDGVNFLSKHNQVPALAVDIYCYNGRLTDYDEKKMGYMAGLFRSVSEDLFNRGIIEHRLEWGGWWESPDTTDMPHYELK